MASRDDRESRSSSPINSKSVHYSGLKSVADVGENERHFKRSRENELSTSNKTSNGNEATVYRDKSGRKTDVVNDHKKAEAADVSKRLKIDDAQYEWGKGSVQKKEMEANAEEMRILASEPFARKVDDPRLEASRKAELRNGDPMARYIEKQRHKESRSSTSDRRSESGSLIKSSFACSGKKPVYDGPRPAPNRMGIIPGYRWDAIDRGNGYEKRIMTKINDKASTRDDEYKWSVSDL